MQTGPRVSQTEPTTAANAVQPSRSASTRFLRRWIWRGLWAACIYVLIAYVLLPFAWQHYEHQPNLAQTPKVTVTHNGIPGDPLNVGLVGTNDEVIRAMIAAHWHPADAVTMRSSVH